MARSSSRRPSSRTRASRDTEIITRNDVAREFRKLDRGLSDAQDAAGSLSSAEMKTQHPWLYTMANEMWNELERMRRRIQRKGY